MRFSKTYKKSSKNEIYTYLKSTANIYKPGKYIRF